MDATSDREDAPLRVVLGSREAAMARSRAYGLLADLVSGTLDTEIYEQVCQVPELDAASRDPESKERVSLDELQAAHYELFGLQVFPVAGVFLNDDGLAGGDRVADMEGRYRHWGFDSESCESADHLSCHLRFMAHLSALELGARASSALERVGDILTEARSFLDVHLLPWSLPLLAATATAQVPLFSEATAMAIYVAIDHRRELGGSPEITEPSTGPDAQEMLANAKTSIRDIAEYLLTPSRSGCWISRDDMQCLGRDLNVPQGFGSRVQLLSNLLRNAAEYDHAEELLAALDAQLAGTQQSYTVLSKELGAEAYAKPWSDRLAATRDILKTMAKALPLAREAETT